MSNKSSFFSNQNVYLPCSIQTYINYKTNQNRILSQFKQVNNVNVVVHRTYGKFVYMLYGKSFFHTTYKNLSIYCMDKNVFSIQHKGKLSMCSTDFFVHTTYGKFVYMLYGQVVYI